VVLLPPFVIALLNLREAEGWRYVALGVFLLMGVSDAIDGLVARRLNQITMLGRVLDPLADKLLVMTSLILLAIEETSVPGFQLPSWLPVVAIGKDVIVVIGFGMIYWATGRTLIAPRPLGKTCTLLQLLTVGFALVAPDLPSKVHAGFAVLYWSTGGVSVIATVDYVIAGNAYASRQLATKRMSNSE
jgi:cardiolipin synthase